MNDTSNVKRVRLPALSLQLLAGLLLSHGLPTRTASAVDSPTTIVQQTTDAVVAVLADKSMSADQKRHNVEAIVNAHFDFETLSRLVLARNWKQLSTDQQRQFIAEFKQHLSMTYSKNVETYNNERAIVVGERAEAHDDWTVKTKVIRPAADDFIVDYRLRKEADGEWRVIDVIIEGVSLVANFRSQFQEIISNQGAAKLIDLLRDKNAKGEPLKAAKS